MISRIFCLLLIVVAIVEIGMAAQLILKPNLPTCTVLIASFDPIKVQAQIPAIGSKTQGQHISMTLTNFKTQKIEDSREIQDNTLFRQNFYLDKNILYELCFTFVTDRNLGEHGHIYVSFFAEENFQSMIGQIKIPSELVGEQNLQSLYNVGFKMNEFLLMTSERQKKEREIEDKLVDLSSHKTERITSITVIECVVIVLSGIYQIFALRRFLIDKNLY